MSELTLFTGSELQQMLLDRTERIGVVVKAFGKDSEVTKAAYAQDSLAELSCGTALSASYKENDGELTTEDIDTLFDALAIQMNLLLVSGLNARTYKAKDFNAVTQGQKLIDAISNLLTAGVEVMETLGEDTKPAVVKSKENMLEDFWDN